MRRLTKFSKEFFQHRKYIKEVEINPKVKSNSFPLKKSLKKISSTFTGRMKKKVNFILFG
jgi:hypothetical protein